MKNKGFFVFGIALVFFALLTGVLFAQNHIGEIDGVIWLRVEGRSLLINQTSGTHHLQITNNNNYDVIARTSLGQNVRVNAGATSHVGVSRDTIVTRVDRIW